MELTSHDLTIMFLSLGVLLTAARVLGEIAQWLHQPSVVGEILAGILLGPTVFGALAGPWQTALFPSEGPGAVVLSGLTTLAITLFLLVAGMEVDLSTAWRQGTTALKVAALGLLVPFGLGFVIAWFAPASMGGHPEADRFIFALFVATALSISALPVIAKTLMDLNLYRSDFGMVIISAAILNDLVGWIIFAVILGMIGNATGQEIQSGWTIWVTVGLTVGFAATMLTVGRWAINRVLPWVHAYTHWPGGVIGFSLALALFAAAFTEWIGIHAIFGAFLLGVAIGDSSHIRESTRTTIDHFISFFFAPLFFASIGLQVNFLTHFDWLLVLTVLVIAFAGKIFGCGIGARWGGMPWRNAWAVGFGMNARGAMEIILGLLAWHADVIRTRLLVALVVMALVTSMCSGPLIEWSLKRRKPRGITEFLSSKNFVRRLRSTTREAAIEELVEAACATNPELVQAKIAAAVLAREQMMSTGIGRSLAVPHARVTGLRLPVVAIGMSEAGVDFNAPDAEPAHLVVLILTPRHDDQSQLEIISSVARTFANRTILQRALQAGSYTEFRAVTRSIEKVDPDTDDRIVT